MPRHKGCTGRKVKVMTATSARYRMWKAMRIMRRFTIPEVVATASQPSQPVGLFNARKYVAGLEKGGYLRIIRPRTGQKMGSAMFLLINDSGPNPPRLGKRGIFDPNVSRNHRETRKSRASRSA